MGLLRRGLTGEPVRILQEKLGVVDPQTLALVPGFEVAQETVEMSLVTESTPTIDPGAVEEVKQSMEAPPEHPSFVENALGIPALQAAGDAVANVGKSIWSTVRSIF